MDEHATIEIIGWTESWTHDAYHTHGALDVDLGARGGVVSVGACVGVEDYNRGTADAAGTNAGLLTAWWGASEDWSEVPALRADHALRDAVLDAIAREAKRLHREAADLFDET